MKQGDSVRRVRVGQKGLKGGSHGTELDEDLGEVGIVTREFSFKWMKIDKSGEAEWVRCEDFEEA